MAEAPNGRYDWASEAEAKIREAAEIIVNLRHLDRFPDKEIPRLLRKADKFTESIFGVGKIYSNKDPK